MVDAIARGAAVGSSSGRPLDRFAPTGSEQLYRVGAKDAQVSLYFSERALLHSFMTNTSLRSFLAIALSNDFVMSSILALSAFHLALVTKDQETKQLAYHHKVTALRGLQTAIGSFSKDNCEAILAASVLLSWQATER